MALLVLAGKVGVDLSYKDIINFFTLSENGKDFGRYVLSLRKDLVVVSRNSTSTKDWKDQYFFARSSIKLNNRDPLEFFLPRT